MSRAASDSRASSALRAAGFVKLPGWWVTQEQMDLIEYMAKGNLQDIKRIKDEASWQNKWRDA